MTGTTTALGLLVYENMKYARAGRAARAKILFLLIKYANL